MRANRYPGATVSKVIKMSRPRRLYFAPLEPYLESAGIDVGKKHEIIVRSRHRIVITKTRCFYLILRGRTNCSLWPLKNNRLKKIAFRKVKQMTPHRPLMDMRAINVTK